MRSAALKAFTPLALILYACSAPPTGSGGTGGAGGAGGQAGTGGSSGTSGTSGCKDACAAPLGGLTIDCAKRFHYGVNYAWSLNNFGRDFGGVSAWGGGGIAQNRAQRLAELQDMRANGVSAVRWWMFPDFRGDAIRFDSAGDPAGIGGTLSADIAAALDIAAEAGVYLELTLFSFDAFRPDTTLSGGVYVRSLAPIAADANRRTKLLDNVIRPVTAQIAQSSNRDRVLTWDVINEPEWAVSGDDGPDQPFDPMTSSMNVVPYETMKSFISAVVATLHATSNRPVTVGGAAIKWAKAWAGIGLDYYTFHMYDWVNQSFPYTRSLADYGVTDKPVVLGEFPLKGLTGVPYATLVNALYASGYAGALGWAVTDDALGPWSTTKTDVLAFANQKGCPVRR